ncbi:MAG: YggS family pyridoxal phosphate-dependent enzyme [Syntrophomonadaceae bacterium]|jgi:pyridoxal phosphate enzyme (YggS family)
MEINNSVDLVKRRISIAASKCGCNLSDIKLVAVSKTVNIDIVRQVHKLGVNDFGENRVQELNHKYDQLPQVKWHFIGRLQTNKAKDVVGKVALIHSLDRWNLAEELDKRGQYLGIEVPCLLQVNVAGETQKAGVDPYEVKDFLKSIAQLKSVRIYGLMTMAPLVSNSEDARPIFRQLAVIKATMSKFRYPNVDLRYLSMGMSQDYEVAIEEGANIVRIGSAIFHSD